ncbi:transcription antitermination factor NusB [Candidatus Babeliales bacterium]|nr:transcription antitermination factor NusB [Candidatus Babeliales bacterium]
MKNEKLDKPISPEFQEDPKQDVAVDLQYEEVVEEPIVNWDKPVKPESQRAHRSLAFHLAYAAHAFDYAVPLETIVENYSEGFGLVVGYDAFSIELARGAIDNRDELDKKVEPGLQNWKLDRLSWSVRIILRLALWERLNKDTAFSVIINEAVELAHGFGEQDSYRIVNGLLDELFKLI